MKSTTRAALGTEAVMLGEKLGMTSRAHKTITPSTFRCRKDSSNVLQHTKSTKRQGFTNTRWTNGTRRVKLKWLERQANATPNHVLIHTTALAAWSAAYPVHLGSSVLGSTKELKHVHHLHAASAQPHLCIVATLGLFVRINSTEFFSLFYFRGMHLQTFCRLDSHKARPQHECI